MLLAKEGMCMTFAEKLITLRAGRGWSQEKLAGELGVTRQAVSRWETGAGLPDALGLTALARVFDVDAEWLLNEAAAGEPEPRGARRARLRWFDWLALAIAPAAFAASRCLSATAAAYHYEHYMYPWYAICVVLLLGLAAFAAAWFAAALACRLMRMSGMGQRVRARLLIASAVILVLLALGDIFKFELFLWAVSLRRIALTYVWHQISETMVDIVFYHDVLYFIPGAMLSLAVCRTGCARI